MPPTVTIIGAGIAGISAAIELAQAGFSVRIIEAKNSIGGRIYSIIDPVTCEMIDNGQHALVGAYNHFIDILDILGTRKFLKSQDSLKVDFVNQLSEKFQLNFGLLPGKFGVLLGFLKFNLLNTKSKYYLISFILKLQFGFNNYVDLTALNWLRVNWQTQESIDNFWSPFIYATLNQSPEIASASLLFEVLKRTFFAGSDASRLILSTKDLSSLLEPFVDWFDKRNGDIIFANPAIKIFTSESKIKNIELKSGDKVESDFYVLCTQPHAAYKLLPDEVKNEKYFSNFKEFNYSTIINIYFWLDKEIKSNDFYALIGGTTAQWVFNRRNFIEVPDDQKNKYPGHLNITISGANQYNDISSKELAEKCFNELKHAFPELSRLSILHSKVIRDRKATFIADPATERIRPNNSTPLANLFVAGDWTDTDLPATIEGAAISGIMAARKIIEQQHQVYII
jgi:squalene-associated FAD-dependent desaturase